MYSASLPRRTGFGESSQKEGMPKPPRFLCRKGLCAPCEVGLCSQVQLDLKFVENLQPRPHNQGNTKRPHPPCQGTLPSMTCAYVFRRPPERIETTAFTPSSPHRWELPGNYPVFTMVMLIYHYVERIWRILVSLYFLYNKYDPEKCYPGESVNIHKQSLINIIQENNWVITTKKG